MTGGAWTWLGLDLHQTGGMFQPNSHDLLVRLDCLDCGLVIRHQTVPSSNGNIVMEQWAEQQITALSLPIIVGTFQPENLDHSRDTQVSRSKLFNKGGKGGLAGLP